MANSYLALGEVTAAEAHIDRCLKLTSTSRADRTLSSLDRSAVNAAVQRIVDFYVAAGQSEKLYCLKGLVQFPDGSPVTSGIVEVYQAQQQVSRRAPLDQNGRFQIGTDNGRDGVVTGTHQVLIRPSSQVTMMAPEHAKHMQRVHPKHFRFDTSELSIEVDGSDPTVEVELMVDEAK